MGPGHTAPENWHQAEAIAINLALYCHYYQLFAIVTVGDRMWQLCKAQ